MKRLVSAGDLRHRVDIQQRVYGEQDSGTGNVPFTWETVWSGIPAQKLPVSAREFEAAAAIQAQVSTRFVIRFIEGIFPKMRLVCNEVPYDINGIMEDQHTGRNYLTLSCTAGVNDG